MDEVRKREARYTGREKNLDDDFLHKLQADYTTYPNFIETGTFMGDTILSMESYFSNLYTIEIKRELFETVKNRYKGDKVHFYLGDSGDVLTEILPTINGKSIMFLDGHWSAGDTGHGQKDCPLYEELQSIVLHHKNEALIIVDDVRLFGMGPHNKAKYDICNWEDINVQNVLEIVKDRLTNYYFLPSELHEQDRLVIHVSSLISH